MMNINLRRLHAFVAVAETQSVSEAAKRLHVSPPAVTKNIRELERELDVQLFHRTSNGLLLTRFGELFIIRTKRALNELQRGKSELSSLRGRSAGHVVVGATPEGSNLILPTAVARFLRRRKDLSVFFRGGMQESFENLARVGEVDFFLGALSEENPPHGLRFELLYQDQLAIICRPEHPLVSKKKIMLNELLDVTWLIPSGLQVIEDLMRSSFEKFGLEMPIDQLIIEPLGALRTILYNTDFVAAVPEIRMREEIDRGLLKILPLSLPETQHKIGIFHSDHQNLSVRARELSSILYQVAREHSLNVPGLSKTGA